MNQRFLGASLMLIFALPMLSACNSASDSSVSASIAVYDKFEQPANSFVSGDEVHVEFSLRNDGAETVNGTYQMPLAKFVIRNADTGYEVHDSDAGVIHLAVMTPLELAPGEVMTFSDTWDVQVLLTASSTEEVPPGRYLVEPHAGYWPESGGYITLLDENDAVEITIR